MPEGLGSSEVDAVIAPVGSRNAGNWTATFDSSKIAVQSSEFECYHIALTNGPPGSSFTVFIGPQFWDSVFPGDVNSWDPHQPMKLIKGTPVYFYWNTGAGTAPMVTMWFQERSPL